MPSREPELGQPPSLVPFEGSWHRCGRCAGSEGRAGHPHRHITQGIGLVAVPLCKEAACAAGLTPP